MKLISMVVALLMAASSANAASGILNAQCGELAECYRQVQSTCSNPQIIDKEMHYGDLFIPEWPGRWPYFTIIYTCI